MRTVVHLISALNVGGTERQLVELVRGLDARSTWRSRIVCFRKTGALLDEVRALGLEPSTLSLHGSLRRVGTLLVVARLASWLRREASVLHCHDAYAVMVGVPAARLAGVPVLAARRDLAHHLDRPQRLALRGALALSTRVLANAATVAAQAAREDGVPAARLVVVPNGIDLGRFDERTARLLSPVPPELGNGPTVLMVGRMIHRAKGHDVLLEAAARVRRQRSDVRFLVAGDGQREAKLRARGAELGLAEHVRFLGRRADVPALLARADVVCHPALAEGLPNAVLEAMAAARPLVATTAGGTPELVRDGVDGLLVPPGDPGALAHALLLALTDPSRDRWGRSARRRVEEQYTLDRLVDRTEGVYDALAEDTMWVHNSPS
jgi:glycosyltransferase involved in cell wall biosynthesis